MTRRRVRQRAAAVAALVLVPASIVFAVVVFVTDFPHGVFVLACGLLVATAAWYAVLRRGAARIAGLTAAALLVAGGLVLILVEGRALDNALILGGLLLALGAARIAFAVHVPLRPASRPAALCSPVSQRLPSMHSGRPDPASVTGSPSSGPDWWAA